MVRKLEVVVPEKHSDEIRDILTLNRSVHHLSFRKCVTTDQFNNEMLVDSVAFTFMVVNKKTHELIDLLTMYGVSSRFGSIDVTALTSTKPRVTTIKMDARMGSENGFPIGTGSASGKMKRKKKYRVSDRLAYDEVYDTIDGQLHLTFDYLALIAVGAVIAAIGLLTDSAVAVVASMLVSPLMGPIVGMTFSAIIRDKAMFYKSFRNESIGVFVCFLTGALMGFITAPILDSPIDPMTAFGDNTQISSRGVWIALAWGAGVAAPSGVGVALGVSSDQVSALIGVAISAALLPPITNSGLCLASALVYEIDGRYTHGTGEWPVGGGKMVDISWHWFEVGYISMLLFLLNWVLIFIFGIMTFRLKKLHESANQQRKLDNLNKFYELREKDKAAEMPDGAIIRKSPKLSYHSSLKPKENLNTPLLTSQAAVNYSDNDEMAVKMKNVVSMPMTSRDLVESMDGVSMHSGATDPMSANGSKDFPVRSQRGMSAVLQSSSRNIFEEMDAQSGAFSKKRVVKRSSFDETKGSSATLLASKKDIPALSDDMV